jgi:HEAT repeat protein
MTASRARLLLIIVALCASALGACAPVSETAGAAAQPAGSSSRPSRIEQLIADLGTEPESGPHASYHASRRQAAAREELILLGPLAVPALIAALEDENEWRRGLAVEALGRIGDRRAVPALIQVLRKDSTGGVRAQAATMLARIGDPRAVDPLIAALRDPKGSVREASVRALGELRPPTALNPLARILADSPAYRGGPVLEFDPGRAAGEVLLRYGQPGRDEIFKALADRRPHARLNALQSLAESHDPRFPRALLGRLRDADPEVLHWTVRTVGARRLRAAGKPLIALLRHPSVELVAGPAAEALGATRDPRGLRPLLRALRSHDPVMRSFAADGLGQLGDRRAAPALLRALDDREDMVRASAARALGLLRLTGTTAAVRRRLRDHDPYVRAVAAEALGRLRSRSSAPALVAALRDPNASVREAAAGALADVGDARALPALRRLLHSSHSPEAKAARDAIRRIQSRNMLRAPGVTPVRQ